MKYYQVALIFDGFYKPDVSVSYVEHRHFNTDAMTCKVSVEDIIVVNNGTEISLDEWRNP